ncbi:MAG: four helix bundle protein [Candidatus Aminicenantes bacterium]|nr:four helix bundle protein [Candidatus Aminicenantes bacterium]
MEKSNNSYFLFSPLSPVPYTLYPCLGSCAEVETQLLIGKDLHYLSESNFTILNNLLTEVGKMLYALITKLKENNVRKGFGRKQ